MSNFKQKIHLNNGLKIVLSLAIVPLLLISSNSHPIADDFCYANLGLNGTWENIDYSYSSTLKFNNFWNAQIYHYTNWSGRYFSTVILTLYPLIFNLFSAYKFISIILLLILFLSLLAFFKAIAFNRIYKHQIFWGSLAFFIIYIISLPSIREGFYWHAGSLTYQLGNATALFLLSLLFFAKNFSHQVHYQKLIYVLACCLLTTMSIGCNEMIGFILFIILAVGTLITNYTKHPSSCLWKITLLTCIICLTFVVLAPGNSVRLDGPSRWDTEDFNYSFIYSLFFFVYKSSKYLVSWLLNPILLSATLLVVPFASSLKNKIDFLKNIKIQHIALLFAVFLGLIIICFLLPFLSRGIWAVRTLNVTYLIFLIGWFLGILLLVSWLEKNNNKIFVPQYILTTAKLVMIFGILFQSNFNQSLEDVLLTSRAKSYSSLQENRYELVRQAISKGEKNLEVTALELPMFPKTIAEGDDLSENPEAYQNICYSNFFGLESIVVKSKK